MRAITRRAFLGSAGLTVLPRARAASQDRLKELDYSQVKLTGGPLGDQYRRIHAAYLKLDEDRILKVYRQKAGMPAPGSDMGGWYDADGFVPGHLIGQFISGLARIYATTPGDAAMRVESPPVGGKATRRRSPPTTIHTRAPKPPPRGLVTFSISTK